MKKIILTIGGLISYLVLTVSLMPALADVRLTFKGAILEEPPCIFNSGTAIDVDFGNAVMTTRIDGVNYIKDVPYNLVCTSPPLNTLRLQVKGTNASFDTKKLATDVAGLAIALTADGKALAVNEWLNFTNPVRPVLKVVPVKKADATLKGGKFKASGTIMVEYQ